MNEESMRSLPVALVTCQGNVRLISPESPPLRPAAEAPGSSRGLFHASRLMPLPRRAGQGLGWVPSPSGQTGLAPLFQPVIPARPVSGGALCHALHFSQSGA